MSVSKFKSASLDFSRALEEVWKLVRRTNKYVDETMPWVLAKEEKDKERLDTVLYNLSESLRIISILIKPFMENTSNTIRKQIGISNPALWKDAKEWGILIEGSKVFSKNLMKKYDIGSLPVIDESSQVIGIVTDRDIVVRVFADILPMNTKVEDIMTHPVHTIIETAEVGEAISLMANKQVRRLPVVDNNHKLVGMISLGDLAVHQLTDGRAEIALKEISEPNTNPNRDLEVDDFPL